MKKIVYSEIEETVYYEKLPNGLEVFMYPLETAKNFYLTMNVKFGSVDTEFRKGNSKVYTTVPNGTAHFLEHQMFQESDGKTAFETFAKMGSSVNAFTTYNYTSYEVVASNNFKENLEYLLDYVQNPVFQAGSVSKEKGIIKEEIKMYDNTPNAVLNFGLEYNLNKTDRHKYTISGTVDDIKEISAETLEKCYDTFYIPSNMFMVLTGRFSPWEALAIIKENQSNKSFPSKSKITKRVPRETVEVDKEYEEREMDVSVPKLKIGYKIDKARFKGFGDTLLKVYLDAILQIKFGPTSDLLEKLLDENLITWDLYASREVRDDYVLLTFETETEYKEQVIDLIRQELKSIKVTPEEIERVKRSNISSFILHFNDIISVAEDLEDDILSNGKITDDIMDTYRNITVTNANKIASYIDIKNESIFYINKMTV